MRYKCLAPSCLCESPCNAYYRQDDEPDDEPIDAYDRESDAEYYADEPRDIND